jgi:hypothetical protein
MNEIEDEIKRLKSRKIELLGKLNLTHDFDEKERYEMEIERIDKQIKLLEKMKG